MIIKTRMEEDWKKQVSARHSEIVGKGGKVPSPAQEARGPCPSTILLPGQCPLLPLQAPCFHLPHRPQELGQVELEITFSWSPNCRYQAGIQSIQPQQAERNRFQNCPCPPLFILMAQRPHRKTCDGHLQLPPE